MNMRRKIILGCILGGVVVVLAQIAIVIRDATHLQKWSRVQSSMEQLSWYVEGYAVEKGQYPPSMAVKTLLCSLKDGDKLLRSDATLSCDPWGTAYKYQWLTNRFTIVSAGPDTVFGTPDDIVKEFEPKAVRR